MKNIINKIKKILTYDISNIFYNVIYISNQKISDLIQRFFLFINLNSYRKTKIFFFFYIIGYVPLMDYTAILMNGGGHGFDMDYRYSSLQYNEEEKIITKDTMASNIIKLKYQYTGNLYNCTTNYDKNLEDLKHNFPTLLVNILKECTQNGSDYSYEIIAEAPLIYQVMYKIESIIKTIPYSFIGIVVFVGTIILSPLLILTDT